MYYFVIPFILVLLFIFLPVYFRISGTWNDTEKSGICSVTFFAGSAGMACRYAAGSGVSIGIIVLHKPFWIRIKSSQRKKKVNKDKEKVEKYSKGEKESPFQPYYVLDLLKLALFYLQKAKKAIHFNRILFRGIIGGISPHQLGFLCGGGYMVNCLSGEAVQINLTPDFQNSRVEGEGYLQLRISFFILSAALIQAAYKYFKFRKDWKNSNE